MSFAKVAPEFDRFLENFIHYELTKDEHPQAAAQSAATNDVSGIKNASTLTYFCVGGESIRGRVVNGYECVTAGSEGKDL